jgi:hypothetical protein
MPLIIPSNALARAGISRDLGGGARRADCKIGLRKIGGWANDARAAIMWPLASTKDAPSTLAPRALALPDPEP